MKSEQLQKILSTIDQGNPNNFYINNSGLALLGAIIFYPKPKQKEQRELILKTLKDAHPNSFKDILASLQKYHLTSYYTPKEIIDYQINILVQNGIKPKTILEPSAGNGAYVQELKKAFPNAKITALEPDLLSYAILEANNLNNEQVTTLNQTFEDYYLKEKDKQKFDLVLSNIPFGAIQINLPFKHEYLHDNKLKYVNNYFNVFAPDLTSLGGICCILTSKTFADRQTYASFRNQVLQNNNLILANRFNNSLFKNEKTKVVSDLFIYQKVNYKEKLSQTEQDFINNDIISIDTIDLEINTYFKNNPEQVNGTLGHGIFHQKPDLTVIPNEQNLNQFFENQYQKIKLEPLKAQSLKTTTAKKLELVAPLQKKINKTISPVKKEAGSISKQVLLNPITLHDKETQGLTKLFTHSFNFNKKGQISYYVNPLITKPITRKQKELSADFAHLKNNITLLETNAKHNRYTTDDISIKFKEIDYQLDMFNFKWGHLNELQNYLQADSFFNTIQNVTEKIQPNSSHIYIKNPNFNLAFYQELALKTPLKQIAKTTQIKVVSNPIEVKPQIGHKEPLEMAKYQYDTTGLIDVVEIANTFKTTEKIILEEALKNKHFFLEAEMQSSTGYKAVPYFQFASGKIEDKINYLSENPLPYQLSNERAINDLKSHRNGKLDLSKLEFNFESHFIPTNIKINFLQNLLKEPVRLHTHQFSSATEILFSKDFNSEAHERFSVVLNGKNKRGYKTILQNFADNKIPVIYETIKLSEDKTERKLNETATLIAQNKYEELQLHFTAFILGETAIKKDIEENYYNAFLADVNLKVDAGWLTYPNTFEHQPYEHQNTATQYALSKGTALLDHKVGMGKTMSMGMITYKLQQHGKSKRTLLLTLPDVAKQVESELKQNFPQFTIFRLTSEMLAPKKQQQTLLYLKENPQINLVIASHQHLLKIPKSIHYTEAIYTEKIEMIDKDLDTAVSYSQTDVTKQMIKGIVKRKDGLSNQLSAQLEKFKKKTTSDITLSDLNIDALLIDEAHEYKNIGYTTRHSNVSGLNSSEDRNKTLDLEITIRSIHDRAGADKGIFFFSGTPIKNSVTELYAYQRYLTPSELKEKNIYNFDAWASIFLKQSVSIEPNILGVPRMNARFRYFTNMPELSKMYNSFTHIADQKSHKTHNLDLDEKFITLDPTDNYKLLQEKSMEFVKSKDQDILYTYPKYSEKQLKSSQLLALNINRTLLVDPLSQPNVTIPFDQSDQHKIQRLTKDVAKLYHKTTKDKGTILVFSDLCVWKKDKYNSYDTIKNILISDYDIPSDEIKFMQQEKAIKKGSELQQNLRDGKVRIAIGSTKTLGTGTNIQKRLVGVFDLDIPYSPDAFDQRLGRALRAGNIIAKKYDNKIIRRIYGIKNTSDIFSFSLNTHKQKFINQLKEANPNVRTYDDMIPSTTDLSYAQMQAALIGDMDSFKLVKLENDLKYLQSQHKLFDISKANSTRKIENYEKHNKQMISQIGQMQSILPSIQFFTKEIPFEKNTIEYKKLISLELLRLLKDNTKVLPFLKKDNKDPLYVYSQINQYLIERSTFQTIKQKELNLLHLPSYNMTVRFKREYIPSISAYNYAYGLAFENHIIWNRNQAKINPETVSTHIATLLAKIPDEISFKKNNVSFNLRQLDSNKENVKIGFPKEKLVKIEKFKADITVIKKRKALNI